MVPILIASVWLGSACKADLVKPMVGDAGFIGKCSLYADQLISYNPAGSEGGSALGAKALGAPDNDALLLTNNGTLTVAFLGLGGIIDKTGDDIRIHGQLSQGAEVAVYVGFGSESPQFSGTLRPDDMQIDISTASARTASYIQLLGISGEISIDALESIQTQCP